MNEMYFSMHQNKVFYAIYEDYYLSVGLFKTSTHIEQVIGTYAVELKVSRCIEDGVEITKNEFNDVLSKAKVRLEL